MSSIIMNKLVRLYLSVAISDYIPINKNLSISLQASGCDEFFFIPTAHTCSNNLVLPRGPLLGALPSEEKLFELYDLAFTNNHFGIM